MYYCSSFSRQSLLWRIIELHLATFIDGKLTDIERRLALWLKQGTASARIDEIPGIGLLTATAAVATMGDGKAFKSGREFAAWLGLVPRQSGTVGRFGFWVLRIKKAM